MSDVVTRLRTEIIEPLKRRFVGRDEVVDLIALAVVAGEHLFLHGPPGTAKSALIRQFAAAVRGRYFEYLLTRFSEPNEVFGPIDLVRLREGTVATVTTGMLPEAEFVFLDELFNANSAILNNLLTVLNERVYRRGAERPPAAAALAVRGLEPPARGRCAWGPVRPVPAPLPRRQPAARGDAAAAGGRLGAGAAAGSSRSVTRRRPARLVAARSTTSTWPAFASAYAEVVLQGARPGRRAVRPPGGEGAEAGGGLGGALRPSGGAGSDLWVLRYVWDREEQIEPLAALVDGVLETAAARAGRRTRWPPCPSGWTARSWPASSMPSRRSWPRADRASASGAAARAGRDLPTAPPGSATWPRRHLLDRAGKLLRGSAPDQVNRDCRRPTLLPRWLRVITLPVAVWRRTGRIPQSGRENLMNAMRMLAVGIVVGLLTAGARAEEKPDNAKLIVGVWEITKSDEGGPPVGATVEFTKDGKMKMTAKMGDQEVKMEGTYKVDGNKFNFTLKMGDNEHSDTITIKKLTKTEMFTEHMDGKVTVDLKRKK